jgi:hypothetical protein
MKIIIEKENMSKKDVSKLTDKDLIYWWILNNFDESSMYSSSDLKNEILQRFNFLPEQINSNNNISLNYTIDNFVIESIGNIEYSSTPTFYFFNYGSKILGRIYILSIIAFIYFFIKFQIQIRSELITEIESFITFGIAISMFLTSFATFKIRHLFFNIVISKFKIGDFLKILKLPDELIHERVKIDQVSNDETFFNKHIVRFSKKERISQLLIKRYYEGIYRQNKDLLIAFIAVDYLHNSTLQIGYKDYLIETAIDILERIYAFNKDSKYILYFLGYYYLLDENYIKSKAFFNKYLNIDSNDLIGVAHLYYINFIEQTVQ